MKTLRKDQATPRPWKIETFGNEEVIILNETDPSNPLVIADISYKSGAYSFQDKLANARLIVKAVNNYDSLVEALKEIILIGNDLKVYNARLSKEEKRCFAIANQALAKSQGGLK